MNATPPPTTGLVAGKYQLLSMIGRGGMGSVWEARHVSLGTRCAIKFIETEHANSEEARSRFDREARSAATLQSKHAIQIFDHGVTDDGKPYIVMELLVGEPLDKRIERMGRMPLPETARILQQVCRALARAHERGIVHRDLKPENIFIVRSQEDDEEIAKVLDFGIAKVQDQSSGVSSSTKTGAVLGTPYYMSPEQARGLRNVDHRTDLWSLGVIGYKCVVGRLPFDGESVGDLLVKICTFPLPQPSQMAQGIPPSFDAWFQRALDREPERRFQSAQELADALAFAAGLPVRTGGRSSGDLRPSAYGPPQQGAYGAATPTPNGQQSVTPHPAAMTGSPFTTSTSGGGGSKVKVALVVTALGALVAGGAIGATALLKSRGEVTITNGGRSDAVASASAPAAASAVLPATATIIPIPIEPTMASAATSPSAPTAKTSLPIVKPAAGKPATRPTADKPATTPTPTPTPPPTAPPPAPTPTAKKPTGPSKDPGY